MTNQEMLLKIHELQHAAAQKRHAARKGWSVAIDIWCPYSERRTMTALEARVRGVNRAHQYANDLHVRLAAVFQPFMGQKIETAPGPLLARVERLVDALDLPNDRGMMIYRDQSKYCLRYVVKTTESYDNTAYYYEASVTVGEMQNGALISLNAAPAYRTDYTSLEVAAKRAEHQAAKRAADAAQSALYPFGEYDR